MARKLLLLFLLIAISGLLPAQSSYLTERLRIGDGLPSDVVFRTVKKDGFLYVATQRGLSIYDGYVFVNSAEISNAINYLTIKDDKLYGEVTGTGIVETEGIYDKNKVLVSVNYFDDNPDNDHYDNIYKDNQGNVWCTDFHNIKYINAETGEHKSFQILFDSKRLDISVSYFESEKELLLATSKGFYFWNKTYKNLVKWDNAIYTSVMNHVGKTLLASKADNQTKIHEYDSENRRLTPLTSLPISQNSHFVSDFQKDSTWMIYSSEKLYQYDLSHHKLTPVFSTEDRINHVFFDAETDIFWISTQKGLIKLVFDKEIISTVSLPDEKPGPVTSIIEDGDNQIWMIKNNSELFVKTDETIRNVKVNENKLNELSYTDGQLLVATESGVYRNEPNNTLKKIITTPLPIKKAVYFDQKYWLIPDTGMIKVYDDNTYKEIPSFLKNPPDYSRINLFNDLTVSHFNQLWLSSWMPKDFGISLYSLEQQKFIEISADNKDHSLFTADYYHRGVSLKNGSVAFSSTGGFNIVNSYGKIVYTMNTRENRIASDNLVGIQIDRNGNIWFGCAEGLYSYNTNYNRPVHFTTANGLYSNDITYGFLISSENILYASNEKTLERIDLDRILKSGLVNKLALTAIKINNESLPYVNTDIDLKEKDASQIDLYFSALNYSGKEKLNYRYRFDNEEWHYLGVEPRLSLVKLGQGTYNITIEVGDNLGNWQKENLPIRLKIIPPFHKSIWFYVIIILSGALLFFAVHRYLVLQKRQRESLNKKIKDNENKMLRSQMNPHFLFNSLNSINSFIIQDKKEMAEKYLTTFSRLMRNILDNSRKETISLKQELDANILYLDLEAVRLDHKFDYEINLADDIDAESVNIPPLILQPFLENAIWHGINHKDEKGFINISIDLNEDNDEQLIIKIQDDGVGRAESAKFQDKDTKHKSHGIDITSERLRLHDIENSVEITDYFNLEKKPAGTIVTLKLNISHD